MVTFKKPEKPKKADVDELLLDYRLSLRKLSRKHRAFVVAMETAKTVKDAVAIAGFKSSNANMSGAGGRLRRRPDVGLALDLQRELKLQDSLEVMDAFRTEKATTTTKEAADLTPSEIVAKLLVLGDEARERKQYSAAIKAIELAGKHIGMWSTKIEVDIKTTYAQLVEASVGVIDMGEAETTDGEESDTPPAPSEDGLPESGG